MLNADAGLSCIYVLTSDPKINVNRVKVCDICHIYDNSDVPFRIFKKRKDVYFYWENCFWNKEQISDLTKTEFEIIHCSG